MVQMPASDTWFSKGCSTIIRGGLTVVGDKACEKPAARGNEIGVAAELHDQVSGKYDARSAEVLTRAG